MDEVVVYSKRGFASGAMVVFALAIGALGYALVNLNQYQKLPDDWPFAIGLWSALGVISWGVVRWRLPYADPLLLPSVLLLNGLGLVMIFRLDQATNPPMQSGRLQLMWMTAAVAVLVAVVVLLKDHRRLQRFTYLWFAFGLGLLLLPLIPGIGKESHGARIWIALGPFSFQPGEIAKVVLSIAFASYLTEKRAVLANGGRRILGLVFPRARDLGPIAVMWLASMLVLVFETDLGMATLFFSLFVAMIYVATRRVSWVVVGVALIGVMGALGYLYVGHVKTRFNAWLTPFANYNDNLQIISAQFGMAWGGLFGTGLGMGRPYLTPLAKNDFIAAAIGEELGLVGLSAVVLIYLLIVGRILRVALAAREPFGGLLASGLGFAFGLQAFIIIGGVTRLLPLTGLTTPFMSQGGSSLIANYLLLGLLLTITHQVRRPQTAGAFAADASLGAAPRVSFGGTDDATELVCGNEDATELVPVALLQQESAALPADDAGPPTEALAPIDRPTGPRDDRARQAGQNP